MEQNSHIHLMEIQHILEKSRDFQTIAGIFRQLGDPTRIRIFWLLCHMEECVTDIASMLDMSSPAVSHHLRPLKGSLLITSRREGKEVYYKAADTPQSLLLHQMIELVMEIACPDLETLPEPLDHRHAVNDIHNNDDDVNHSVSDSQKNSADRSGHCSHCEHASGTVSQGQAPDHTVTLSAYQAEQIETIRQIHEQLSQHLDQRWNIEDLAKQHLMNATTLKMLFKAVYGTSIAAHIHEHRMEESARLLLETNDSICAIAQAVGYNSQSRFSSAFKEFYGILPRDYRKDHSSVSADISR